MPLQTQATARYLVVHALKLKGLASACAVAEVTGLDPAELDPALDELVGEGHAKLRTGRVAGYTVTPDGRAAHPDGH